MRFTLNCEDEVIKKKYSVVSVRMGEVKGPMDSHRKVREGILVEEMIRLYFEGMMDVSQVEG